MNQKLSISELRYLREIYILKHKEKLEIVTNKTIADKLKIKPQSAGEVITKLKTNKLLTHTKAQGINISKPAEITILKIIRRELLWKKFLIEHLKIELEEALSFARDASFFSKNDTTEKLSIFLGDPLYDQFGEAIPTKEGKIDHDVNILMTEARLNTSYKIIGFLSEEENFKRATSRKKLTINAEIRITEICSFEQLYYITINNQNNDSISYKIAKLTLLTEKTDKK